MSMTPDRVLLIPGASNFRDYGGYAGHGGAAVPTGRLFRSAHFGRLTPEGADRLVELGVVRIVDLRGTEERLKAPAALREVHDIEVVSTPVEPHASPRILEHVTAGTMTPGVMRDIMIENYRRFPREDAAVFGRAVAAIAEASTRGGVVVHCTAGKDRTGFTVALVHALLGVDRDSIITDYLATNDAWDRGITLMPGMTLEAAEPMLAADPDYLEVVFDIIARDHGSVEAFAVKGMGIEERLLDHLRDAPKAA